MSACEPCQRAAIEPWGLFHASCRQCQARMLSRSPEFFASVKGVDGKRLEADAPEAVAIRRRSASYRKALGAIGILDTDVIEAHRVDAMGKGAGIVSTIVSPEGSPA